LFIDSSKISLKAVLLHNWNKYPSVPLAHAVNMSHMKIWNFSWKWITMKNICGISAGIWKCSDCSLEILSTAVFCVNGTVMNNILFIVFVVTINVNSHII
jgi:hypothetical protein